MGRASKRQTRAKQELQDLSLGLTADRPDEAEAEEDEEEAGEGEEDAAAASRAGAFAALGAGDDAGEGQEDASEEDEGQELEASTSKPKAKKKKKKKKAATGTDPDAVDSPQAASTSAAVASGGKKKATKVSAEGEKADDGVDEIDRALQELGVKQTVNAGGASTSAVGSSSVGAKVKPLLAIDVKMLDSEAELRRMFGSKVIASAPRTNPSRADHPRLANNPHHALNHRHSKSSLAKPLSSWPPYGAASGTSLSTVLLPSPPSTSVSPDPSLIPHEQWHSFVHPPAFRAAQADFISAVSTLDPNQLFPILSYAPYHPDSLMQLSDVSAHQGDPGQSADFLDRALYAFERGFSGTFSSGMSKGEARLDFGKVENRGLFRALEKKVGSLAKRGCWRAACEFAKLLLALDPYEDPYGALLLLDFLAPKAKEHRWLVDLWTHLPEVQGDDGIYVEAYPGLAYGRALSLFHLEKGEDHKESTAALRSAILRFPMVLPPLSDKTGFPLPAAFLRAPRSIPQTSFSKDPAYILHLQSQLYVSRAADLWKEGKVGKWLEEAARWCGEVLEGRRPASASEEELVEAEGERRWGEEIASGDGPYGPGVAPAGILRHVFVSDIPSMKAFLPPSIQQSTSYSFDPLPPPDGTSFDEKYFSLAAPSRSSRRSRAGIDPALQRFAPHEELVNALHGPRGLDAIVERIQMALQADEGLDMAPAEREEALEQLQQLLAMRNMAEQGPDGGVGAFPPAGEDDEDGEEGEGEEDEAPAGQGGWMNGLWGMLGRGAQ